MRTPKWLVAGAVILSLAVARAQRHEPEAVLFLNAEQENVPCLVGVDPQYPNVVRDPQHGSVLGSLYRCPPRIYPRPFLIQGQRAELRVFNRKFFADYSLTVDFVAPITSGPQIRNLSEAESLTLAPGAPAAPPSKGGAGGLSARTAADILNQLLDETTATQPQADLEGDEQAITRQSLQVRAEIKAFKSDYRLLRGTQGSSKSPNLCKKIGGSADADLMSYCLEQELDTENCGDWNGARPFTNEPGFRDVNTRVGDLIVAVQKLGAMLTAATLPQSAQKIETDVAQYETNLTTFSANIQAALDATTLFSQMIAVWPPSTSSPRTELRRQQMRALLMQKLQAGSKPILDDAEMNALLDKYEHYFAASSSVSSNRVNNLSVEAHNALKLYVNPHNPPSGLQYILVHKIQPDVGRIRNDIGVDLPNAIDEVNAQQGRLLARVNFIYDHSEVPDALPVPIDLSGHPGNLIVYFTMRRVETFKRYSVAQVQGPGGAAPTSSTGTPLPPPAKGEATGAAQTTGASPNSGINANVPDSEAGTTTPPAAASRTNQGGGAPSGVVVAKGDFEVHDLYRATVVAAFAFSVLQDQSIAKQAHPTACTGTAAAPDNNCFSPVLANTSHQLEPIVGVDVYFRKRDTYPGAPNSWYQKTGFMGAVSISPPNSFFVGGFWEPWLGMQLAGGANIGMEKRLQSNFQFGTPVDITSDFPTVNKQAVGAFVSAGLDLDLFRKIFGKVTGIGTSASSTQGQ